MAEALVEAVAAREDEDLAAPAEGDRSGRPPLRIAVVAPYDLAGPGGVSTQIRHQTAALRALGHHVTVFGPSSSRHLAPGEVAVSGSFNVNVGGTVSGMGFNPLVYPRIRGILKRGRYDVLHVHEPLVPIITWLWLYGGDLPRVATFHVFREDGHRIYPRFRWFLKHLMRRLDYRIAVSDAALDTVAPWFPGDYEIVPNGVDAAFFRQPEPRPAEMDGARCVLFVGRAEERKGLRYVVEAMARVAVPGVRLIVSSDGPLRRECEQLARSLGVDARFLGALPNDALPRYYQHADVYCSPATGGESFGVVNLEAMAAGTAIVASDIPGYRDLLAPAGAALLVPPQDPAALAAALSRVLSDDRLRADLRARGTATVAQYDWQHIAVHLEGVYRSVIASRATVRAR